MMPPKRYNPRWHCDTCKIVLGRIGHSTGGERMLYPTDQLKTAERIARHHWRLTCQHGHDTEWRGVGIKWFEREAA